MMKTLQIDTLVRVEKANLNAQMTEGNITTLKKFKDVDGKEYVYISATSIKYWLKERMKELIPEIWENPDVAPRISTPEKAEVLYTPAKPITYVDADLFGYLDAKNNKKRYAPIKFSGLISLYPYTGDIDFGVRYDPKGTDHTLHHIEITANLFRGTWMILLDWIGRFISKDLEENSDILKDKKLLIGIEDLDVKELPIEERKRRLKLFLKALFTMNHFTKQTNLLTDTQPRFAIITLTKVAKPMIFDRLSAAIENKNGRKVITFTKEQIDSIKKTLEQHSDIIEKIVIVHDPTTVMVNKILQEFGNKQEKLEDNNEKSENTVTKINNIVIEIKTVKNFLDNLDNFVNEILSE